MGVWSVDPTNVFALDESAAMAVLLFLPGSLQNVFCSHGSTSFSQPVTDSFGGISLHSKYGHIIVHFCSLYFSNSGGSSSLSSLSPVGTAPFTYLMQMLLTQWRSSFEVCFSP